MSESTDPTAEDVGELFEAFRRTRGRKERNRLVERHFPLAERLARRYAGRGEPYDDVLQVALVGLVKSVERYEPGRGVPFEGFATPTITGEVKRHFRDTTWSARVGRRAQELQRLIPRAAEDLSHELGRSPSITEIADRIGVARDDVLGALDARSAYKARSLSMAAPTADGTGATIADRLGEEDPSLEGTANRLSLRARIARLPERERELIRLRFEEELTQSEIAERLGISQMHVSRLLRRTLDVLRAALESSP